MASSHAINTTTPARANYLSLYFKSKSIAYYNIRFLSIETTDSMALSHAIDVTTPARPDTLVSTLRAHLLLL